MPACQVIVETDMSSGWWGQQMSVRTVSGPQGHEAEGESIQLHGILSMLFWGHILRTSVEEE